MMVPSSTCTGTGSTDPLLQIPHELSAVLTLKRGAQIRATSIASSPSPLRNSGNQAKKGLSSKGNLNSGEDEKSSSVLQAALSLKKKRESIV